MNSKAIFGIGILLLASMLFSCNKDKDPPVITIIGSNPMNHCIDSEYVDPGAIAHDEEDGDITDKINTKINVDEEQIGIYTVVYTVEDDAGNSTAATRTVNVIYCK